MHTRKCLLILAMTLAASTSLAQDSLQAKVAFAAQSRIKAYQTQIEAIDAQKRKAMGGLNLIHATSLEMQLLQLHIALNNFANQVGSDRNLANDRKDDLLKQIREIQDSHFREQAQVGDQITETAKIQQIEDSVNNGETKLLIDGNILVRAQKVSGDEWEKNRKR